MATRPHLLVVDDHDAFRELTALRLRALGCTCVAVRSVPGAIDALSRERFDVVLSDHSMPGPSGLDLLAYMRHRHPDTPFVLMSSWVEDELRTEALALGARSVHDKSDLVDSLAPVLRPTRRMLAA
jgi:two-component system capsular synthesis sensor histidine kinase RcsC